MSGEAKKEISKAISEIKQKLGIQEGEENKTVVERKKMPQKTKMMLDMLAFLEEFSQKYEKGENEEAMEMLDSRLHDIEGRLKRFTEKKRGASEKPFSIGDLRKVSILGSDDVLELVPIRTETDVKNYLKVHKENDDWSAAWDANYENDLEKDILTGKSFYCSIYLIDTDEYIGYCGINNIEEEPWDLAIELLEQYQHLGYGYRAMACFMNCMKAEIGETHFKVRVDPDNVGSQKLMKKLGFKPAGITTYYIYDEKELKEYEEDNIEFIDERLIRLAQEFQVEPKQLLSHILVYEI